MSGVWNVLGAILAIGATYLFWILVVLVIPGIIAVYAGLLFPLTGQWRKKWRERRLRRRWL